MRDPSKQEVSSEEVEALAARLSDLCPWSTVSTVLNHSGWVDVVECIKAESPDAYEKLKRDVMDGTILNEAYQNMKKERGLA